MASSAPPKNSIWSILKSSYEHDQKLSGTQKVSGEYKIQAGFKKTSGILKIQAVSKTRTSGVLQHQADRLKRLIYGFLVIQRLGWTIKF